MKYQFKIRFNTQYQNSNNLFWKVLINDHEHLFKDIIIKNKEVRTIHHVIPSGEQKWSIYCESDNYRIESNTLIIE